MSALPPKADIRERVLDVRFGPQADSCTATKRSLFDHFLSSREQRRWDRHAERFGGPKIDEFKLDGLLGAAAAALPRSETQRNLTPGPVGPQTSG